MTTTKRYLLANRYGPRLEPKTEKALEAFLVQKENAKAIRSTTVGRRVVEMSEETARELQRTHPELLIEEDQTLALHGMPGLPGRLPTEGKFMLPVTVRDSRGGSPVAAVTIYGVGKEVTYKAVTNEKGQAKLETREQQLQQVIASPRDTFWSRVMPAINVEKTPSLEFTLNPLVTNGSYGWGQLMMGFHKVNPVWRGRNVKVAVIDSGLAAQCATVRAVGGYNALNGADPATWNNDEKGHGTHVSGLLAAQGETCPFNGAAPDAQLYEVKVAPGGNLSDLIESIEWCIANHIDIINISMGVREPSRILGSVVQDAYDRGITLVAAAGNDRGPVAAPANLSTTLAVSAFGRLGTFPEDSGHRLKVTAMRDRRGEIFAAQFNNLGREIGFCAPGIAMLSTVPTGYAAWDGTSAACPLVTALVALILEAYPFARTGNAEQVEFVRNLLVDAAYDLGMPSYVQGVGFPLAPLALAQARVPSERTYSARFPGQRQPVKV